MSITVRRTMLTVAGAAVLASVPGTAMAQVDPRIVLNILVECSKIDDVMARVACYDTNIRGAGAPVATAAPPQSAPPQPSGAPVAAPVARASGTPQPGSAPVATGAVAGVARESARSVQRPAAPAGELARRAPTVTAVTERRPGAYLVTLEDGAQWEFAEDMGLNYRAPRRGSTVEIERGALGGYRLRFDGQQPVRVQRIR